MNYPDFFDKVEHIILKDKLSEFLGSSEEGIIDISYLDIVKMAGHSCATVAGIYLMAQKKPKNLIAEVMKDSDMKKIGKEASKYAQQLMKTPVLYDVLAPKEELLAFTNSIDILKEEFGCVVEVVFADDSKSDKAGKAVPGKPGIEIF